MKDESAIQFKEKAITFVHYLVLYIDLMSSRYKFYDREGVYFVTSTVVDWIMPNHFHLICSFINSTNPGIVIKNIKSFTAMKLIDAIINNLQENRKEWMLDLFEKNGQRMKSNFRPDNYRDQFPQHENHPILLNTKEMYNQRLIYFHENPERAGFVKHPIDWKHSSAIDYYTEEGKGLLALVRLDCGLS